MKRKLIQLSPSTAVVSLPAKWIRKNNLKKGQEITIQEIENSIMLSTSVKESKKTKTVDLTNLNEELAFAYADATYIAGYDEITFLINESQRYIIDCVSKEFPGMIISNQTKTSTTFKDITGNSSQEIDLIVNRVLNMVISLIKEGFDANQKKEWEQLKEMKKRDYVINSYISYCQRLINKYGYSSFSKSGLLTNYLKLIEMISDDLCETFETISKDRTNLTKDLNILIEVMKLFQRVHERFSEDKIKSIQVLKEKVKSKYFYNLDKLLFTLIEVEIQFQI